VIRETTSRGLRGLVCPSRTSERGGEGYGVKEGRIFPGKKHHIYRLSKFIKMCFRRTLSTICTIMWSCRGPDGTSPSPMPMRVELNCGFAFLVVSLKSKMHHFTAF
jgi:hypothetical protein